MKSICSKCGQTMTDDDAFCGECGAGIVRTGPDVLPPVPVRTPSIPVSMDFAEPIEVRPRSARRAIIAAVTVAVFAIVAVGVRWRTAANSSTAPAQATSTSAAETTVAPTTTSPPTTTAAAATSPITDAATTTTAIPVPRPVVSAARADYLTGDSITVSVSNGDGGTLTIDGDPAGIIVGALATFTPATAGQHTIIVTVVGPDGTTIASDPVAINVQDRPTPVADTPVPVSTASAAVSIAPTADAAAAYFQLYIETALIGRDYLTAWSMLSDHDKSDYNVGFDEFTSFWSTIDEATMVSRSTAAVGTDWIKLEIEMYYHAAGKDYRSHEFPMVTIRNLGGGQLVIDQYEPLNGTREPIQ